MFTPLGGASAAALAALFIVTAPATAAPAPVAAGAAATTVRCRGDSSGCSARVSLAGGASNKRVTIQLTDTDFRLLSVRPNRRALRGAYSLSHRRFSQGGSLYQFTLNAVQSIPRGAYLTLTFRAPAGR